MIRILAIVIAATLLLSVAPREVTNAEGFGEAADGPSGAKQARATTLVIAGVPQALSAGFEGLNQRFEKVCGLALRPLWWRLDMAAFESRETFDPADIARKLGFHLISTIDGMAILAPRLTPETVQAEARVFLMQLFLHEKKHSMWRGILAHDDARGRSDGRYRVAASIARVSNKDQKEDRKEENDKVFLLNGPLSDQRVLNTLGLTSEDLAVSLRFYSLSDFLVSRAEDPMYQYRSYYPDWPDNSGLLISARTGRSESSISVSFDPWQHFPSGRALVGSALNTMRYVFPGAFSLRWPPEYTINWYSSLRPSDQNSENNPYYVSMLLEGFTASRKTDAMRLHELQRDYDAISETDEEANQRRGTLLRDIRVELECTLHPQCLTWLDPGAKAMRSTARVDHSQVRATKRYLVDAVAKVLAHFSTANGPNAIFPQGALSDWNLRQSYNFPPELTQQPIGPYRFNFLELINEADPAYIGQMVLRTTKNSPVPAFSVRIEPVTSAIAWISGEPLSEEFVKAREEEVVAGVECLLAGIHEQRNGFADSDSQWVENYLREKGFVPRYTALSDFHIHSILPGIVRVIGESATEESRQSVLVDLELGNEFWETKRTDNVKK